MNRLYNNEVLVIATRNGQFHILVCIIMAKQGGKGAHLIVLTI
jgi:hypothetical protein